MLQGMSFMKTLSHIIIYICFSAMLVYALSSAAPTSLYPTKISAPDGAALYQQRCAVCHDKAMERVPPRAIIEALPLENVIQTMTTGVMKPQAAGLTAEEIRAIVVYLTGRQPIAASPKEMANRCKADAGPINLNNKLWNGWGRDLDNSHFQPEPGLKAVDVPKLKVKWAFAYQGNRTWGQPTIIGDRLYVTDWSGQVYCLNAQTGCTYWQIDVGAGVRTALSIGPLPAGSAAKFAAYFGDLKGFVHAIDAETGKLLWKTKVDDHIFARLTGAPALYKDRLYVPVSSTEEVPGRNEKYECCKFRGAIVALDAYTGKLIWKSHTITEPLLPFKQNSAGTQQYGPAGAAIWSAPTLDLKRKLIYAGTGNSYTDADTKGADAIIAFDMETGKIVWSNQVTPKDNFLTDCWPNPSGNCPKEPGPDVDFSASPILRRLPNGKQIILAGQKSGVVSALDPDQNGKVLWQVKVGEGGSLGGIQWGHAADEQNVYAAISDVMPMGKRNPGIAALNFVTGKQVWYVPTPKPGCSWGTEKCEASQSAAVTVIPDVVFSGAIDGHLRAYATKDGTIIWDFDTAKPWDAVNGGKANGGSLDVGGPTIANGILYVNSGYGIFFGRPGNTLLAFSVDGKGVCLANGQKTTLSLFSDRINPLLPASLAIAASCGSSLP
jgi:polyvinyl alcohol dehydrogenase (cytochrome)